MRFAGTKWEVILPVVRITRQVRPPVQAIHLEGGAGLVRFTIAGALQEINMVSNQTQNSVVLVFV